MEIKNISSSQTAVHKDDMMSDALDAVTQAIELFGGLEALFNSIYIQTKDNPVYKDTPIFYTAKMGSYVCNNFHNTLDYHKEGLEKHLELSNSIN